MQYLTYISLVLAFIFTAAIKSSPLEEQMGFILAALIVMAIIYTTIQRRRKVSYNALFNAGAGEIFFISSIVLIMIEITGGVDSSIYFLNYFLLFGLPLISSPIMALIFVGSILFFYLPDLIRGLNVDVILRIGSILLLLPLSYFLSNELLKRQREKLELKEKVQDIQEAAQDLEANEDDLEARDKIDDIIESAQSIEENHG